MFLKFPKRLSLAVKWVKTDNILILCSGFCEEAEITVKL